MTRLWCSRFRRRALHLKDGLCCVRARRGLPPASSRSPASSIPWPSPFLLIPRLELPASNFGEDGGAGGSLSLDPHSRSSSAPPARGVGGSRDRFAIRNSQPYYGSGPFGRCSGGRFLKVANERAPGSRHARFGTSRDGWLRNGLSNCLLHQR